MSIEELQNENARLKAEVERLTAFTTRTIIPNEELQKQVERLTRKLEVADNHAQCLEMVINAGTANELRLQAEVERLTKVGDAMASSIPYNEEMEKDYDGTTIAHQRVQRWNAAKEGKQSK